MKLTEKRKDGICNVCVGIVALIGGYVTVWIVFFVFFTVGINQFFSREKEDSHGTTRFSS